MVRGVDRLVHRQPGFHEVAQLAAGGHHEQRRRNSLARHVGHDEAYLRRVLYGEEIVEVAADFLGRLHGGVDVETVVVGECRELRGQG